jgi:hypothetical protein
VVAVVQEPEPHDIEAVAGDVVVPCNVGGFVVMSTHIVESPAVEA